MFHTKCVNKQLRDYPLVANLYKSAFPKNERMPLWFLNHNVKRGVADFLAYYDNDEFIGLSYSVDVGSTTGVLYIAIMDNKRSLGYGSKLLEWLKKNKGEYIVLDIESVDIHYNDYENRLWRRDFYIKNGFMDTGYIITNCNDVYDVLTNNKDFSKVEYEEVFKKLTYGFIKRELNYKQYDRQLI